ncbi:hypothetical protein BJ994_000621 [Arthrobacter pigmenti]|uniref:G5 domain-containing protein n=1 Tax=Arthrobacter pigmenti TaxID=271432 RepID=A0A846RP41_9MICC|nr:G5 domain-containing protein [Arthrobacter pigmenti]NJC21545.1 hypothetical protein [Arthrobacter pigmenti]
MTIRVKAKLCLAILGVGLLALTGCGSTDSAVADPDSIPTATASPSSTPSSTPSPKPTPSATPTPEVTVTEEWIESDIPFESVRQDDPNAELGSEALLVAGVAGVKATRYEVTFTDGVETARVAAGEEVRIAPVTEVIGIGSKPAEIAPPPPVEAAIPAGNCDPNYAGDCVPIDSDVDCASGSGNGPSYVQGPVTIVGTDIYDLDGNDGDGVGCEN